jgi:hypothetical protein
MLFQLRHPPACDPCVILAHSAAYPRPELGSKASPAFYGAGKEALLRVNPEPLGFARGLEFVERQAQAFWPGSRRVDMNPSGRYDFRYCTLGG